MIRSLIRENAYFDSVTLMLVSRELKKHNGVEEIIVGMGTALNLSLVKNLGLMSAALVALTPGDFFLAVKFDDAITNMQQIENAFNEQINQKKSVSDGIYQPPSLKSAIEHLPDANLVQISVPGQYAAAEVEQALDAGLHVMLFSDNVSLEDELRLKTIAVEKGLLLMGPDCGTAIINGIPLCFANAVRRGSIGVVGASGTGTQEVTTQIHKLGEGLSQVIGTGGRDLKEEVGGLMMMQAFKALMDDPATAVIVLISKPPAASVAAKIYHLARQCKKPVIIDFIGGDATAIRAAGAIPCISFEDAAHKAVAALRNQAITDFTGFSKTPAEIDALIAGALSHLNPDQTDLRALYTGGTLADEAMKHLGEFMPIYSNIPLTPAMSVDNLASIQGNICLDLGEDQFTRGRPHPMIDPATRDDFFASHVDVKTAVVLLDVVLGFGSHINPAGAVVDSVSKVRAKLAKAGRDVVVVASVTGTDQDVQDLHQSTTALEGAGVIVMPSNAQAVRLVERLMHTLGKGAYHVHQ